MTRDSESKLVDETDAEFFRTHVRPLAVPAINGFWDISSGIFRIPTMIQRITYKNTYLQRQEKNETKKTIGYSVGAIAAGLIAAYGLNYAIKERTENWNPIPTEIVLLSNAISIGRISSSKRKKD